MPPRAEMEHTEICVTARAHTRAPRAATAGTSDVEPLRSLPWTWLAIYDKVCYIGTSPFVLLTALHNTDGAQRPSCRRRPHGGVRAGGAHSRRVEIIQHRDVAEGLGGVVAVHVGEHG